MLVIDRAARSDLEALLPLVAAYRAFYGQPPDPRGVRAFLERHLRDGTSAIFIARDDAGQARGFMQLFTTFSTVKLGPSLILEDLYVAPEARGTGIAAALLARAREYAVQAGATSMFLETATDNVTAQRVYERAGWSREQAFYKYNAPSG